MTSRHSELNEAANKIYEILGEAYGEGFRLQIDRFGRLDLVDPKEGLSEPIMSIRFREMS